MVMQNKFTGVSNILKVYIPVLNGERFVKTAIESVLQNSRVDEVIVLLNKSFDDSEMIINKINSPKLRLVKSDKKLSMFDNFNRALDGDKGDFVCILPVDDKLLYTPDEAICQKYDVIFFNSKRSNGIIQGFPLMFAKSIDLRLLLLRYGFNPFPFPGAVWFSRGVFQTIGGFDKQYGKAADVEYFFKLLQYKWVHINVIGSYVLTHEGQQSREKKGLYEAREYFRLARALNVQIKKKEVYTWLALQRKECTLSVFTPWFLKWVALRILNNITAICTKIYDK